MALEEAAHDVCANALAAPLGDTASEARMNGTRSQRPVQPPTMTSGAADIWTRTEEMFSRENNGWQKYFVRLQSGSAFTTPQSAHTAPAAVSELHSLCMPAKTISCIQEQ